MNDIVSNQQTAQRAGQPLSASQAAAASRRPDVQQAIAGAAQQSTVDFDYLLAQAQVESSLNPRAKARTSSATGLFQFIESTWLSTVKKHGHRFGLGDVAAKISTSSRGGAFVPDPGQRDAILALRNDPQVASFMAAGLAEDNRAHLTPVLGREPDHNELYLAHFLGAGGASRFLSALQTNPDQSAASVFPRPAAANRPVFYERDGSARSLSGVMDYLDRRMDRALDAVPQDMRQQIPFAPYLIADEGAFGPLSPPTVTYGNQPVPQLPRMSGSLPPIAAAPSAGAPVSMSSVLQSTFGDPMSDLGGKAGAQVRRAYDQLRAFGL